MSTSPMTSLPLVAQNISVIVGRRPANSSVKDDSYYDTEQGHQADRNKHDSRPMYDLRDLGRSSTGNDVCTLNRGSRESLDHVIDTKNQDAQRLTSRTSGSRFSTTKTKCSSVTPPTSFDVSLRDRKSIRDRDPRVNRSVGTSAVNDFRSGDHSPMSSGVTGMLEGLDETISRMRNYVSRPTSPTVARENVAMTSSSIVMSRTTGFSTSTPMNSFSSVVNPAANGHSQVQFIGPQLIGHRFGVPLTLVQMPPWPPGVLPCTAVVTTGSTRPVVPPLATVGDFPRPSGVLFAVPPPMLPQARMMTTASTPSGGNSNGLMSIRYLLTSTLPHQLPLQPQVVPYQLHSVIHPNPLPPCSMPSSIASPKMVHMLSQVDLQRPPPSLAFIPSSTSKEIVEQSSSSNGNHPPSSVPTSVSALSASTTSIKTSASVSREICGVPCVAVDVTATSSSSTSAVLPSSSSSPSTGGSRAAVLFLLRRQQSIISEITRQLSGDLNAIAMFLRQTKPDEINDAERTAMTSIQELASSFGALTPVCMTYRVLYEQVTGTTSTPGDSPPGTASGLPTTSSLVRQEKLLKRCRASLVAIFAQRRELVMQTAIASQQRLMTFAWLDANRVKILDNITIVDAILKETTEAIQIPDVSTITSSATSTCSPSKSSDVNAVSGSSSTSMKSVMQPTSTALLSAIASGTPVAEVSCVSPMPTLETIGRHVDPTADGRSRKTSKKGRRKGVQAVEDSSFSEVKTTDVTFDQASSYDPKMHLVKIEITKPDDVLPRVILPETIIFDADDVSVSLDGGNGKNDRTTWKRRSATTLMDVDASSAEKIVKTETEGPSSVTRSSEMDVNPVTGDEPPVSQSTFIVDKWFKKIARLRKHFKKMKNANVQSNLSGPDSTSSDNTQLLENDRVKCEESSESPCSSIIAKGDSSDHRSRHMFAGYENDNSSDRPSGVAAASGSSFYVAEGHDDNLFQEKLHQLLEARDQRTFSRLLIDSVCSMPQEDFQRVREMLLQRLAESRGSGTVNTSATELKQSVTEINETAAKPPPGGHIENSTNTSSRKYLAAVDHTNSSIERWPSGGNTPSLHLKIENVRSCDEELSIAEKGSILTKNSLSPEDSKTEQSPCFDADMKSDNRCADSCDVTTDVKRRRRRTVIDDVIVVDSSSDEEVISMHASQMPTMNVITIAPLDFDNVSFEYPKENDEDERTKDFKVADGGEDFLTDQWAIRNTRHPTPLYQTEAAEHKPVIGAAMDVHNHNQNSNYEAPQSGQPVNITSSSTLPSQFPTTAAGACCLHGNNSPCAYHTEATSSVFVVNSHQSLASNIGVTAPASASDSRLAEVSGEAQRKCRRGLLPTPPPTMLIRNDDHRSASGCTPPPFPPSLFDAAECQRSASCLVELSMSMTSLTRCLIDSAAYRRRSPEALGMSQPPPERDRQAQPTRHSADTEGDYLRQCSPLPMTSNAAPMTTINGGTTARDSRKFGIVRDRQPLQEAAVVAGRFHLQRRYLAGRRSDSSDMVSPSSTSPGSCFNVGLHRSRADCTSGPCRDDYDHERTIMAARRPDMDDVDRYDVIRRRHPSPEYFNDYDFQRLDDEEFLEDDEFDENDHHDLATSRRRPFVNESTVHCYREDVDWREERLDSPVNAPARWPNDRSRYRGRRADFVTISRRTLLEMKRQRIMQANRHRNTLQRQEHGDALNRRLPMRSRCVPPDRWSEGSVSPMSSDICRNRSQENDRVPSVKVRSGSSEKQLYKERDTDDMSINAQREAYRDEIRQNYTSFGRSNQNERPPRRGIRMSGSRGFPERQENWCGSPVKSSERRWRGGSDSSRVSEFVKQRDDSSRSRSRSSMLSSKNEILVAAERRRRRSTSPLDSTKLTKLIDVDKNRTSPRGVGEEHQVKEGRVRRHKKKSKRKHKHHRLRCVSPLSVESLEHESRDMPPSGSIVNKTTKSNSDIEMADRKPEIDRPDGRSSPMFDSNSDVIVPTVGHVTSGLNLVSRSYTSPIGSDWSDTDDIPDSDGDSTGSVLAVERSSTSDLPATSVM